MSRASTIRAVVAEDAPVVGELIVAMLSDSPLAFGENLVEAQNRTSEEWQEFVEYLIAPPTRAAFLASDRLGACGFICVDSTFPKATVDTVVISRLWVAPRQRGTGLGRRLMEAATRWALDRHAGLLTLGVTEMNTSAMEFYKHLGYSDIGIRIPWPPDPSKKIVVLGKELDE